VLKETATNLIPCVYFLSIEYSYLTIPILSYIPLFEQLRNKTPTKFFFLLTTYYKLWKRPLKQFGKGVFRDKYDILSLAQKVHDSFSANGEFRVKVRERKTRAEESYDLR